MLWGDNLLITQEQFNTMKYEILECKPSRYDMLCTIVIEYLGPQIKNWCFNSSYLRGREEEGDILNDVVIRLMQRVVTGFFGNEFMYADDGNDVKRFAGFIRKTALRIFLDHQNKVSGGDKRSFLSLEDEIDDISDGTTGIITDKERREVYLLEIAKNQVMDLNVNPYKIIAWLAVYVFMLVYNFTKKEANRYIDEEISKFTLYEAYDFILETAEKVKWLEFSPEQKGRILDSLREPCDGDKTYADMRLEEVYMKKGGLASLCDWWNRINGMLDWTKEKEVIEEVFDDSFEDGKKDKKKKCNNKKEDGDENDEQ